MINESDYLHLIPACIKSHFNRVPLKEDLTLQALIGLRKGISTYDPKKKGKTLEQFLYQSIRWRCGWYMQAKNNRSSPYFMTGKKGAYEPQYRHVDQAITHHEKNRTEPESDKLLMLRKALDNGLLSKRQKEIIYLYYYKDLSIPEIAEMDGTTKQNISLIKRDAERKLKRYFEL